jgi:hypothetical protein
MPVITPLTITLVFERLWSRPNEAGRIFDYGKRGGDGRTTSSGKQ